MGLQSLEAVSEPHHHIIGAMDQQTWEGAETSLAQFGDLIGLAKLNALADRMGADEAVKRVQRLGNLLFLDWKIYDVDNTNFSRAMQQTLAGASIITVHGANAPIALAEAKRGVDTALKINRTLERPWLAGVTVLTSIQDGDEVCQSIFGANRATKVRQFAECIAEAGYEAVVCSPQEADMLRRNKATRHLKRIVPAIRPTYALKQDEQRFTAATPRNAVVNGADFLVVGRPLYEAEEYGMTQREAAEKIVEEYAEAA